MTHNFILRLVMLFKSILMTLLLSALPGSQQVADRIVALVDEEPVLLSEVYQLSRLEEMGEADLNEMLQNRLEGLINRKLMLQEIRVLRVFRVTTAEVEAVRQQYLERLGEIAFGDRLREAGISGEEFNSLIREGILIEKFIEYKFRRGISISSKEQRDYYNTEFVEDLRTKGIEENDIPSFNRVQEEIEAVLIERRVTERLQTWLTNQRAQAQIVIRY